MTIIREWLAERRLRRDEARVERTQQLVRTKLTQLGESAADVAAALRTRGITGYQSGAETCPIANYLRDECGDAPVVSLTIATVDGVRVGMPPAACRFITLFDRGVYPDLITSPVER